MRQVTFKLIGKAPYSQSRVVSSPKLGKETHRDHEARTWIERLHVDASGDVFIPPMAIKNALSEMAKFFSMPIPGRGKSTYTKHLEAGVLCFDPVVMHDASGKPIKAKSVRGEWLFVPSNGKRGSGSRVDKCFPVIDPGWTGQATLVVLDDMITDEVLRYHLEGCGKFIGIGRFRPRNNGFYGRFEVADIEWSEIKVAA